MCCLGVHGSYFERLFCSIIGYGNFLAVVHKKRSHESKLLYNFFFLFFLDKYQNSYLIVQEKSKGIQVQVPSLQQI